MPGILTVESSRQLLNTSSQPVNINDSEHIDLIIKQLLESIPDKALGLAAPQIGILERVFIANLSDGMLIAINPEVTACINDFNGKTVESNEGCLSIPGYVYHIQRYNEVYLTADKIYRINNNTKTEMVPATISVSGDDSRIIQHEMDHIDGILVCDRGSAIETPETRQAADRMKKRAEKLSADRQKRKIEEKDNKRNPKIAKPQRLTKKEFQKAKKLKQKSRIRNLNRAKTAMRYRMQLQGINLVMPPSADPEQPSENIDKETKDS